MGCGGAFKRRLAVLDTKPQVVLGDSHDRKEGIVPNSVLRFHSWYLQTDSTSLDPSLNIFSHH